MWENLTNVGVANRRHHRTEQTWLPLLLVTANAATNPKVVTVNEGIVILTCSTESSAPLKSKLYAASACRQQFNIRSKRKAITLLVASASRVALVGGWTAQVVCRAVDSTLQIATDSAITYSPNPSLKA